MASGFWPLKTIRTNGGVITVVIKITRNTGWNSSVSSRPFASRLESSVAKPGMVVIGENTHQSVGEEFDCHPLGAMSLKGKAREVQVFEVVGTADEGPDTFAPTDAPPPGGDSAP